MLINGGRPVYAEKTGLSFSRNSYRTTSSVSNAMNNVVYFSKADMENMFLHKEASISTHLHNIKATSTFILRYNALIQTLQRSPNTLGIQGFNAYLFLRQTDVINGH